MRYYHQAVGWFWSISLFIFYTVTNLVLSFQATAVQPQAEYSGTTEEWDGPGHDSSPCSGSTVPGIHAVYNPRSGQVRSRHHHLPHGTCLIWAAQATHSMSRSVWTFTFYFSILCLFRGHARFVWTSIDYHITRGSSINQTLKRSMCIVVLVIERWSQNRKIKIR